MQGIFCCGFLSLGELLRFLGHNIVLMPVLYFSCKILQSFPWLNRSCAWLWRCCRHTLVVFFEMSAWVWSTLEWVHRGIKDRQQQNKESRDAKQWRPPCLQADVVPQRTPRDRIRQLLCDDMACTVCDRVAQEALLYSEGADGRHHHDSIVRSASEPASDSAHIRLAPGRPALPKSHPFADFPAEGKEETAHVAQPPGHDWKPKGGEEGFVLPLIQHVMKRMPSIMRPSSSKKFGFSSGKPCQELSWDRKRQMLQRHLAKKALEFPLGATPYRLPQSRDAAYQAGRCVLPKVIPPRSNPRKLRSQELLFVDQATLHHIQLNIIHKHLAYRWGLPTIYSRSLARLFQLGAAPHVRTAFLPKRSTRSSRFRFTARQTPFLGQRTREAMEWHVRRKGVQHTWGLPRLIQRSIQSLMTTVPQIQQKARHREVVAVSSAELAFLSKATKRELERNVQKRVLHQRWLLPRRVLESLRLLYPTYELGGMMGPEGGRAGATRKEQGRKKARRMVAATAPHRAQLLPPAQSEACRNLQLHLAKKCLEVHLESLPAAIRVSRRCTFPSLKRPFPKMIRPGHKPLLPRRSLLPCVCREEMSRIDMAVRCNHLTSLWELGTRYVEALRGMMPGRPSHPPRRGGAGVEFSGVQAPVPQAADREALELHVKRKRFQHEWGFPGLVQRSLKGFINRPPSLLSTTKASIYIHVLVLELVFLPRNICSRLEFHLQKMKLHHLWGLPRRVLESLGLLHPVFKAGAPRQKPPAGFPFEQGDETFSSSKAVRVTLPVSLVMGALCTACYKRRAAATTPHLLQGFPTERTENLEKIQLHLAKKCMEVQLEAFPALASHSWRGTVSQSQPLLPKWLPPGHKPLQPRKGFLPFVPKVDAERMEVSVHLRHLASLWGLGTRYTEALRAVMPGPLSQPLRRQRAALKSPQVKAQLLQGQVGGLMELHMRKKRLQHEWGVPALVQRSLRAFMPGSSLGPGFHKTTLHVRALQGKLPFLPQGTCSHLEFHIQRLKLQRQWGLPRRVLESLRLLFPETAPREGKDRVVLRGFPSGSSHGACPLCRPVGPRGTVWDRKKRPRMPNAAPPQPSLCLSSRTEVLEKLHLHVSKKHLEVHLEAFPPVPRGSWRRASLSLSQTLPKLIHPGLRPPQPRSSPFSSSREQMDRIELALRRSHLASLWGLASRYTEALAGMVPRLPFPSARLRGAACEFSEAQTRFFQQWAREALEFHVRKKRIQRSWGIPSLAQRSLQGFMQEAAMLPSLTRRVIGISVACEELAFLPWDICSHLEHHVQRQKLQRRWGLPGRVLESLRRFLPPASLGRAPFPQSDKGEASTEAESDAGEAEMADMRSMETSTSAPKTQRALEYHLDRKYIEICLKLHPDLSSQSRRAARRREPLPAPSHPPQGMSVPPDPVMPGHRQLKPARVLLTRETWDLLEFHIQRKRLQHEWGLPSAVRRSLRAFAPFPPEPERRVKAGAVALARAGRPPGHRRQAGVQNAPQSMINVIIPSWVLQFLSTDLKNCLEAHVRSWATEHRWGLPRMIQNSLRAFAPPQLEFHSGERKQRVQSPAHPCKSHKRQNETHPHSEAEESLQRLRKGAIEKLKLKPSFFTEEVWNRLEFHIQHKRIQHAWGQPAMVLKSVGAFAPFPHKPEKRTQQAGQSKPRTSPWERTDVHPVLQNLSFIRSDTKERLEAHMRTVTTRHRWELPKRVQGPLRRFLTPRPHSQPELDQKQPRSFQRAEAGSQTQRRFRTTPFVGPEVKLHFLKGEAWKRLEFHVQRKKLQHMWGLPSMVLKSLKTFAPLLLEQEEHTPLRGESTPKTRPWETAEVRPVVQYPSFLSSDTKERLEAHMRTVTTKHRWELPKRVQESLRALLPPRPHSQPEPDQKRTKSFQVAEADSKAPVTFKGTAFSEPEVNLCVFRDEVWDHLELHVQRKKLQHMWGLPSMVLKSLKAFAPFPLEQEKHTQGAGKRATETRTCLQAEVQPTVQNLSFLGLDTKERLEAHMRTLTTKHRWELPKRVRESLRVFLPPRPHPELDQKQPQSFRAAEADPHSFKGTAFSGLEVKLHFLKDEAYDHLEFHVQRKKLQHMWGLPSMVLKSLKVFAPFPLEPEKHAQGAGEHATKTCKWSGTELQPLVQHLSFLSSDTKERLEAHLKTMTTKHKWGLPKRVQESLKALLPPRPASWTELGQLQPKSFQVAKADSQTQVNFKVTTFLWPEVNLHFLKDEAYDRLEFHIQHKKLQHMWGLPSMVLKSLGAFAPFPRKAGKHTQHTGESTSKTCPWGRTEVQAMVQSLSFLSTDTKERLEAHMRTMTTRHRWELPKRVQESLRALLPPRPLSLPGGIQAEEQSSAYCCDMALQVPDAEFQLGTEKESSSSSEDTHIYCSELYYEEGQDGGRAAWTPTGEPGLCLGAKPQHFTATPRTRGPWKAGREGPKTRSLEKKPLQRSAQHRHPLETTQRQHSRISARTKEPGVPPLSLSGPLPPKYSCKTNCWSAMLPGSQRATFADGRPSQTARGRDAAPRSSRTSLRKKRVILQQPKCGVQGMAGQSHRHPSGQTQPQASGVSCAGCEWRWSPETFQYPCMCHLSVSGKRSFSLLQSDAEHRWQQQQQQQQEDEAPREGEANSSLPSEDHEPQNVPGLSSGESMTDISLSELEASPAYSQSLEAGGSHQHSTPISQHALRSCIQAYPEGTVATHGRQAGREHRGEMSRKLQRRGSKIDCSQELLCQILGYRVTASMEAAGEFQDLPERDLQPQTDDDVADSTEEEGTSSASEKQRHFSRGTMSQFSTESEWERVGDWNSGGEADVGSEWLDEGEGGAAEAAEEMPRKEAGLRAQRSPRWAESLGANKPQAYPEKASPAQVAPMREARAIHQEQKFRIMGQEAASGHFEHLRAPRSTTGQMDRDTDAFVPPGQRSPSPQSLVFQEESHASVEVKQSEVLLCGRSKGERAVVGQASTTGPEVGSHQRAREEEEMRLIWGREAFPREAAVGKETFLEDKMLKALQALSKGRPEGGGHHPELIDGVDEKISILARILERKLCLRQGLSIWMQSSSEKLGGSWEEQEAS
ncbi:uncharacterized protein LOC128343595 [Hemicordylus capensis]|uniref:uncharacterized protein LOC128343595 n=1 Tax=Hemicordylus capensis TaxID=884348 RepID=UPI00230315B9|nr:uncharacterized protein LOC128343595 [Hemicordylus capensis]